MAKAENGDNLEPIKQDVREGYGEVVKLKEERKSINDAIAAVRSRLETKGIRKEAFDMALKYLGWDEDKRKGFDLAYSIVHEALGAPVNAQGDLVELAQKGEDAA